MTEVIRRNNPKSLRYEAIADENSRVIWVQQKEFFMLKFRVSGRWYYQWLCWAARAGRPSYYPALVSLYRTLRRKGLVERDSFHRLAGAWDGPRRRRVGAQKAA